MSFLRRIALLLGLGLVLAGCRTAEPTPTARATARPAAASSPSATPEPRMACRMVARAPATPETRDYLLPQDHLRGSPDAPVLLVVYADFQCPGCAALAQALQRLQAEFPAQVAVVYRHFPLAEDNDKALLAVQAAEAAARQGAFWAMHDALYARQDEWAALTPAAFRDWLLAQAPELGLDPQRLAADLDDPSLAARAQAAWEQGRAAGLDRVPMVFVNGELYTGPPTYTALRTVVALHLLSTRQFHRCPPWVIQPTQRYRLTLHTNRGPVVLVLDPTHAPQAVNSLVFLAQQGWYDGSPAYRIDPGRAVYLGDPSGTGYGHAGYFFDLELHPSMRYDRAGWVGLVNDGPGTQSSRFFITLGPLPEWDGRATRVGRVVQGLAGLQDLPAWDGQQDTGPAPLILQRVEVTPLEP